MMCFDKQTGEHHDKKTILLFFRFVGIYLYTKVHLNNVFFPHNYYIPGAALS